MADAPDAAPAFMKDLASLQYTPPSSFGQPGDELRWVRAWAEAGLLIDPMDRHFAKCAVMWEPVVADDGETVTDWLLMQRGVYLLYRGAGFLHVAATRQGLRVFDEFDEPGVGPVVALVLHRVAHPDLRTAVIVPAVTWQAIEHWCAGLDAPLVRALDSTACDPDEWERLDDQFRRGAL